MPGPAFLKYSKIQAFFSNFENKMHSKLINRTTSLLYHFPFLPQKQSQNDTLSSLNQAFLWRGSNCSPTHGWAHILQYDLYLRHRESHPQQVFSLFQESSSKHHDKVGPLSNLIFLHGGCHHQHLGCRVLNLKWTSPLKLTNIVFSSQINLK